MKMAGSNNVITGIITPSTEGNQQINFGKSINKYFLLIEMTEQSKRDLIDAGLNKNKAFAFWAVYPKPVINGKHPSNNIISYARYNASTDSVSQGDINASVNDSGVQIGAYPIAAGSQTALIVGYTYKWTVVPFE